MSPVSLAISENVAPDWRSDLNRRSSSHRSASSTTRQPPARDHHPNTGEAPTDHDPSPGDTPQPLHIHVYPVLHVNLYADIGGPDAFPPSVWNTLARPDAEQRIRRLLALPGQPDLHSAARELGIRHAILASQVRQLEATTGTTLLRIAPGTPITLTPEGEQFAREALTALNMLRVTTSAGTE